MHLALGKDAPPYLECLDCGATAGKFSWDSPDTPRTETGTNTLKLNPMNTAPKDTPILLDTGYPWLVMAIWNDVGKKWVYANLQIDLHQGEWNDTYWQNEYEAPVNSKGLPNVFGWMPVPKPDGMEIDRKVKK